MCLFWNFTYCIRRDNLTLSKIHATEMTTEVKTSVSVLDAELYLSKLSYEVKSVRIADISDWYF